jgi:hypothetical protein
MESGTAKSAIWTTAAPSHSYEDIAAGPDSGGRPRQPSAIRPVSVRSLKVMWGF